MDSSFLPSGDGEDVSSEAGGDQPSPLDSAGMLRKLVCRRICSCKLTALLLLLWAAGWRVVGSGTNACRRRSEEMEGGRMEGGRAECNSGCKHWKQEQE